MNIIKRFVAVAALIPFLALGVTTLVPSAAGAAANPDPCDTSSKANIGVKSGKNCAQSADQQDNLGDVIKNVTNVLLFIIGAIAVIMIILGGIRYTTSNGDSNQVTAAKNTILYAVIGLVVALLAYAIVNFVITAFSTTAS